MPLISPWWHHTLNIAIRPYIVTQVQLHVLTKWVQIFDLLQMMKAFVVETFCTPWTHACSSDTDDIKKNAQCHAYRLITMHVWTTAYYWQLKADDCTAISCAYSIVYNSALYHMMQKLKQRPASNLPIHCNNHIYWLSRGGG